MDKSQIAISTYNKIADKYTELYFNDQTDDWSLDMFTSYLPHSAKVLDAGCGPGQFSKYLQDKGYKVEGIDLSDEMLAIAKERVPKVNFQKMDLRDLNFPNNEFDGIVAAYTLIHIPTEDLPKTLNGFHKVLKHSGILLIIAQKGEPDRITDEPLKEGEKTFINFFTLEKLKALLNSAKFKIVFEEEKKSEDPDGLSEKMIYMIAKKNG